MNITTEANNPFTIRTTRRRCGRGEIIIDAYDDGDIVATTIRVAGERHAIRTSEYVVLKTLLDGLGDVVIYAEFGRPQDSVRRDLGRLREVLEACDLDLDVVRHVGYRIRTSRTRIRTERVGDIALDIDANVIARADRSIRIGAMTMRVLIALRDDQNATTDNLYRRAWGAVPHNIDDTVASRVGELRRALERIGSATRIVTLRLKSKSYYTLRLPTAPTEQKKPKRRFARVRKTYDPGFVAMFDFETLAATWTQASIFDAPITVPTRRMVRVRRDETAEMIPMFEICGTVELS